MGEFFSTLLSGMSLDSLLVYACAIRGVMVTSAKADQPSILTTLLTRKQTTSVPSKK